MAAFCELCQRYFNNEKDLQQHINDSRAHMGSAQLQSDVRNPMQSKLPSHTRQKQTVTSHASQVKHDHTKIKTKSSVGPKWTTIHESQQMMTLDILSAHCHSPKDLISNNFTTQPYNWLDHVDSRRCDRCKGTFLGLSSGLYLTHSQYTKRRLFLESHAPFIRLKEINGYAFYSMI